jgi:uncharacterized membrane protein
MQKQPKTKRELIRIDKRLNEIITVKDSTGRLIHKIIKPVMVEVYPRDITQILLGSALLSLPIAFTEEVWELGISLPWINIILLLITSLSLISFYVYYNFYRRHFKNNFLIFLKRILITYIISLLISGLILFLIGKFSVGEGLSTTLKRMIILSFPASIGAAITDSLK